ncbi:hypothetical protein E2C01_028311 [Portunus trituberculatus]|uniref:Uncharacterized protein n=1 Tax=Portunus trituberculatus TaxID=210409 RepID=A0A5B7ENR3_PORTR|nr:hypothetical protein [Portunus trituberculatus]
MKMKLKMKMMTKMMMMVMMMMMINDDNKEQEQKEQEQEQEEQEPVIAEAYHNLAHHSPQLKHFPPSTARNSGHYEARVGVLQSPTTQHNNNTQHTINLFNFWV